MRQKKEKRGLTVGRWAALLMLCLLLCTGCEVQESQPEENNTISVYYINKAETKITPVSRERCV